MSNPITINAEGQKEWTHQAGDTYLATGKDRAGKRFRIFNSSWAYISALNLWQGQKWLVRNGKKHLIQRITN